MRTSRITRLLVLIAAAALLVAACGQSATTSAPGASQAPGSSAAPPASQPAANGEVVELRWYCCLGGGDDPEQVEVEQQVVEEFNASHPNIHLTFEAVPYEGARDALATQIAAGNSTRHRRTDRHRRRRGVPRPVARPPAAHRLDRL